MQAQDGKKEFIVENIEIDIMGGAEPQPDASNDGELHYLVSSSILQVPQAC